MALKNGPTDTQVHKTNMHRQYRPPDNRSVNNVAENALIESALRLTQGFGKWPLAGMRTLVERSKLRRHRRGDVFAEESVVNSETLAVVSGYLMGERLMVDASVSAVGLVGPGTVVGLSCAMFQEARPGFRYRAHTDSVVIHIPSYLLLELLDSDPALWKDMAGMLLRQKREMHHTVLTHTLGSLNQRLAATIERLAHLYGTTEGNAVRLRLRITQEDLAALLQVSRPTINKALRTLESEQVLALEYKTITILDRKRLQQVAE